MSYGFTVKGENKTQVKAALVVEFDKVVRSQPFHANDRDLALAATSAFIDLLTDDASRDVRVAVNGSAGWDGAQTDPVVTNASISINASLVTKGQP